MSHDTRALREIAARMWKQPEPRGFFALLTPEQRAAALAYRGDDTIGPERRKSPDRSRGQVER